MRSIENERGAVLVFATLIIVLLLIMVGMGLDTGHLAYIRAQGQPAVDAAALAATAAIPTNNPDTVRSQATKFNSKNNYLNSPNNAITSSNVTLIHYDPATQKIIQATGVTSTSVGNANGVRVALENSNPYGGPVGAAMNAPLFLTPLLNLFGLSAPGTANVSVSAVAMIHAIPGLPISIIDGLCGKTGAQTLDFHGGGSNTAGWTTYYIDQASNHQIQKFFDGLPSCEGQPAVDTGFCTNLNNGVIGDLFNHNLKDLFNANPTKCYLLPVVSAAALSNNNFNQCSAITDWARFCPDANWGSGGQGTITGTVTCGQSPFTSSDTSCYVPRLVRDTKSGM